MFIVRATALVNASTVFDNVRKRIAAKAEEIAGIRSKLSSNSGLSEQCAALQRIVERANSHADTALGLSMASDNIISSYSRYENNAMAQFELGGLNRKAAVIRQTDTSQLKGKMKDIHFV